MFPGLILAFDSTSEDVMKEEPRDSEEILSKNVLILLFIFGILLVTSMVIVYFITINEIYPVFPENWDLGELFLYSSNELIPDILTDVYTDEEIRTMAKTLTMLMVTLFFCESFLVFQIRRPNKSLFRSLKEDSNKRMYLIIGFLFSVFLMLMYIPNAQVALARAGINFMFMYLTALDWMVCFLISLICIITFEIVKYVARKYKISF